MDIVFTSTGQLRVERAQEFNSLRTLAPEDTNSSEMSRLAGPAGYATECASGDVFWVSRDWLRQQVGSSPADRARLEAMFTYAEEKGWIGQNGEIRSHIEWTTVD